MQTKHKKQWEFLKRKYEARQLSHAYLFSGQKNLGKKDFAMEFLKLIDCKFPDFSVIEDGGEIKIYQIREAQNFLRYRAYNGNYKAIIVDGAEKMNQEAQNCFLKTLEEPKGKTVIILISSKPDLILPTIYSRCQVVKFFGKPQIAQERIDGEKKILKEILPIVGRDLSEKFKYAKSLDFEKQSLWQILEVLQKHYRNLLLAGFPDARRILKIIDEINFKASFTNVNPKLALEILLLNL